MTPFQSESRYLDSYAALDVKDMNCPPARALMKPLEAPSRDGKAFGLGGDAFCDGWKLLAATRMHCGNGGNVSFGARTRP